MRNKWKTDEDEFTRIYQDADGTFLPDSSQPNKEEDFAITSKQYTPHSSTRYINVYIGTNGIAALKDNEGNLIDSDKKLPDLYTNRGNCCGCWSCYSICPICAIEMRPDEEGFLYPVVNAEKCIRCYKCLSVCDFT